MTAIKSTKPIRDPFMINPSLQFNKVAIYYYITLITKCKEKIDKIGYFYRYDHIYLDFFYLFCYNKTETEAWL